MKPIHAHLMLQLFLYSWNLRKLLLVIQKTLPEDLCQSWKRLPQVIHPSENYIESDMEISDGTAAQDEDESSEESSADSAESRISDPED